MKIYLHKFLGYLLISLSLALTFGSFGSNPFAKKYDPIQRESFCRHYPQSCKGAEKDNSDILFVAYPKLAYLKYVFGSILLLLGIVILIKGYKNQVGIHINPKTVAITVDIINILFLGFAAYCVWAFLFHHLTEARIYLYDYDGNKLVLDMIAFSYIPAVAITAFFTSNIAGQSIEINSEGVTVHYPGGSEHFAWNNIVHLKINETFTVAGGEGMLFPRKMQTKLLVKSQKKSMELFEPGLEKIKKKIIAHLQQFAPTRLQDDIARLAKEW